MSTGFGLGHDDYQYGAWPIDILVKTVMAKTAGRSDMTEFLQHQTFVVKRGNGLAFVIQVLANTLYPMVVVLFSGGRADGRKLMNSR